jgi:hypothetical protein
VIVLSAVHVHLAASEKTAQVFQDLTAAGALHNHKGWLDLPAHRHASITKDWAAEATLAIYEADDPSLVQESFLRIFRISHIVTAVHA